MNNEELIILVDELRALARETEWVEFKKGTATTNERLGMYISGLSNSACVKNQDFAYLIFGIDDITHEVIGTNFNFKTAKEGKEELELWIKRNLTPSVSFEHDVCQYNANSRIILVEKVNKLIFRSAGGFFEGKAEDYCEGNRTTQKYRNKWLANAMVNLNMIDSLGFGISKMYRSQMKRFFPLPDYTHTNANEVVLEIYGHTIDVNYSKLLIEKKRCAFADRSGVVRQNSKRNDHYRRCCQIIEEKPID